MAETKTSRSEAESEQQREGTSLARQGEGRGLRRRDPWSSGPLEMMDRMAEEMDQLFERMMGSSFGRRSRWRRLFGRPGREDVWYPRVDAVQKGDTFVIRADLPGIKKDDIDVEITEDAVTIRGERKEEQHEEREGYWRTEREYGQFYRTIPLPEGVISDSAKATFQNGVLEITMQAAPSAANRGRRLEISEGGSQEPK